MLALLLDCLAGYRLTRLVTADTITEPARAAWIEAAYVGQDCYQEARALVEQDGGSWDEVVQNDPHPPRLAELVTCRWCAGMWIGLGVVLARRLAPRAWDPLARALTVSALAALLARLED